MTSKQVALRLPVWLLLSVLALAGCGASPDSPPAEVDELVAELVGDGEPGLALMVVRDGEVVHEAGYGLANLEDERENTPQTIVHLASCGKQVTGVAIMMLAADGELAYDDPVAKHVGELASLDERVTIRRLLQHTGALPDVYEELGERTQEPTNEDLLALLASRELEGEPGDKYSYSNVGLRRARLGDRARLGSALRGLHARADFRPARDDEHVLAPQR